VDGVVQDIAWVFGFLGGLTDPLLGKMVFLLVVFWFVVWGVGWCYFGEASRAGVVILGRPLGVF